MDYQNDVHAKDLTLAAAEGYADAELAKRYTTSGMATDQGKLGNINAAAILAKARGIPIAEVGLTTFRPFYTPSALALSPAPRAGMTSSRPACRPCTAGPRASAPSSWKPGSGIAPPGSRAPARPAGGSRWTARC
ncbi:hypothetical protein [Frigidibacter mobilis]|uniref:hypothetical protein n=1 Tax=Frigidibacter mobilis TaxID=1335048 RepID=UPI000AA7BDD2|nr:hypothetical protein [Frigidibacter mobilis]